MYEEFTLISGYVCKGLFSIGEDGFGTRRMTSFCKLFGRYQDPERELHPIRDYLCTTDAKADSLARIAKKQQSFVVHMDADHPVWFTESV